MALTRSTAGRSAERFGHDNRGDRRGDQVDVLDHFLAAAQAAREGDPRYFPHGGQSGQKLLGIVPGGGPEMQPPALRQQFQAGQDLQFGLQAETGQILETVLPAGFLQVFQVGQAELR